MFHEINFHPAVNHPRNYCGGRHGLTTYGGAPVLITMHGILDWLRIEVATGNGIVVMYDGNDPMRASYVLNSLQTGKYIP